MKVELKSVICFILLVISLAFFIHPENAWSKPKGKLVIAQGGEPTTFDPKDETAMFGIAALRQVYDSLVRRIFKDGKIQNLPMLATSWEITNDTTWIFHLRKDVKFHNGEEFNAEAVKYSIDRILDPAKKAKVRYAFDYIDRVEIIDPYTVKIITKLPAPTLIMNLGYCQFIVPPKYVKEKGDEYLATNPVGTGPFKFLRWKKDNEIVFEANEDYWAGPPHLKTLVFNVIPEDSTRASAFVGGDVDIAKKIPTHLFPLINNSRKGKVMTAPSAQPINCPFNTLKKGPLQDKRVRQAINYGVDRENIIKYVLEGYGTPLATPLSPAHFGSDASLKPYPYDPQKAESLLKEAGYKDGFTLTFSTPSGRYVKDKEVAEAIVGQLSKLKINVKVEVLEWGNYMAKLYSDGMGDMYMIAWAGSFDADGTLYQLYQCRQPLSRWCNKEFSSLLDQARGTLDQERREKLYFQASRILNDEAAALFLHVGVDSYAVSNRVQNWNPTSCESTSLYMYEVSVKD